MPTTVEAAFSDLLQTQQLTQNQAETARARVANLRDYFTDNFEMHAPAFTMGSYARGTLCRSERDIDMLAPFAAYSPSQYWQRYQNDSRRFLYWVRDSLNTRFANTQVSSRQVAVVLDFTTIATDIVPCFASDAGGYVMPDGRGRWQRTNPPYHTDLINAADTAHNHRLKPLIKLIKFWNIANGHHLRSFHVELMVKLMWDERSLPDWPAAVASTLGALSRWVATALADPWSGGRGIDGYLSAEARAQVQRMLAEDTQAAALAEEHRRAGRIQAAFDRWRAIYRNEFPAYG